MTRAMMLLALLIGIAAPVFADTPHPADAYFDPAAMARARHGLYEHMGMQSATKVSADRFEVQSREGDPVLVWDADVWHGGDLRKLWLKSEGESVLEGSDGVQDAELQVLYSRAVSGYFDLQAGVRQDFEPESRTHAVLGVQGLAPYFFELDAAAFLSEEGDLTARVELEYELLLSQRLILEPRVELAVSAQDVPELSIGSGLSGIEAGLRLRYEVRRAFAPYLGVSWSRSFGDTRGLIKAAGEDASSISAVVGLRFWF